jgi:hypothetical protein
MAEKVTEQLWEISDIVDVLETWEMAGQGKHSCQFRRRGT